MATSIINSVIGSNAAKSAAKVQSQAAQQAAAATMDQYQQNREDLMPWMTQGTAAVNKLGSLLGTSGTTGDAGYGSLLKNFTMNDFEADPGYSFRQSEGQKALERSAASKGGLLSGAAAKAIQQRGQDIASDEYGSAYNRFRLNQGDIYNRLSGVAGTGQTATTQIGTQGLQATGASNDLLTSAAAAQAAGKVGSANAWTTGLTSADNSITNKLKMLLGGA